MSFSENLYHETSYPNTIDYPGKEIFPIKALLRPEISKKQGSIISPDTVDYPGKEIFPKKNTIETRNEQEIGLNNQPWLTNFAEIFLHFSSLLPRFSFCISSSFLFFFFLFFPLIFPRLSPFLFPFFFLTSQYSLHLSDALYQTRRDSSERAAQRTDTSCRPLYMIDLGLYLRLRL